MRGCLKQISAFRPGFLASGLESLAKADEKGIFAVGQAVAEIDPQQWSRPRSETEADAHVVEGLGGHVGPADPRTVVKGHGTDLKRAGLEEPPAPLDVHEKEGRADRHAAAHPPVRAPMAPQRTLPLRAPPHREHLALGRAGAALADEDALDQHGALDRRLLERRECELVADGERSPRERDVPAERAHRAEETERSV